MIINYIFRLLEQRKKGHSNFDFVDVVVNDDNLLFIDSILLISAGDEWSQEAKQVLSH